MAFMGMVFGVLFLILPDGIHDKNGIGFLGNRGIDGGILFRVHGKMLPAEPVRFEQAVGVGQKHLALGGQDKAVAGTEKKLRPEFLFQPVDCHAQALL